MNAQNYQDPTIMSLEAAAKSLAMFTTSPEAQRMAQLAGRLAEKLKRPIRVALGGEFSSGKSSLANMLLGKEVINTSVTASTLPTVISRFAEEDQTVAHWPDGTVKEWDSVTVDATETDGAERIVVCFNRGILKQFEFLDTPGTGDPTRDEDQIEHMARTAHMVLWCTNGAQAWRETERHLWADLPKRLHDSSILVVTHVDMPRVAKSVDRLMGRMKKEALPHFSETVPVATLQAQEARNEVGEITDKKLWTSSGGEGLLAAMNSSATEIRAAHRMAAQAILDARISPLIDRLNAENAAEGAAVHEVEEVALPPAEVLTRSWLSHLAALNADVRRSDEIDPAEMITRCGKIVHNFYDSEVYPKRDALAPDALRVFDEFGRAGSRIAALAGQRNKALAVQSVITILAQLGFDVQRAMSRTVPKAAE